MTTKGLQSDDSVTLFFLKDFIYFNFIQGGTEGEREGEKHQCVVASHASPTGDLDSSPGMCTNWESNWQPFGSQATLDPLSHTSQGYNSATLICTALLTRDMLLNMFE